MKNHNSSRYRSLLVRGARALAITFLLLCGTGCHSSKDTGSEGIQPTSKIEVSTTCTTTSTTATTVSSSTTSSTTTSVETTTVWTTIQTETQIPTTVIAEIEPTTAWVETNPLEPSNTELPITEYERILLCNVVAREYGSDWVSVYDKACVVATVMNRVNSPQFPNTIEAVLTQPYQFSGYWACDYEWSNVTDSVREAVNYYFSHQGDFGNYLYFFGDGTRNYFY